MNLGRLINGALRLIPTWVLYLGGLVPALWLTWLLFTGGLGIDPVKVIEHRLGKIGLQLMVAALAVSPLRKFTGISLTKFRRAIGLLAFFYISLHLACWLALDIQFLWGQIWGDILKRPYITVGMAGFAMLLPLAATSNDASVRRLGAAGWRRLQKLSYAVGVVGALHYVMAVKGWQIQPLIYTGVILALLIVRMNFARRRASA